MELDAILTSQIAAALFAIAAAIYYFFITYPKNLPPGPCGLPFLGYALFLGKKPHETINELKKKYGDIIRLKLGRETFIFLTSCAVVKEALIKQLDVFSSRPIHHYPPEIRPTPGIAGANGDMWSEFRRFSLSKLRDFGIGKSSLEPKIEDEIAHFLKEIEFYKGKPIPNVHEIIHTSIFNVICVIMSGQRYEYTDKTFRILLEASADHLKRLGIDRIIDYIPHAIRIPSVIKFLGIQQPLESYMILSHALSQIVNEFEEKNENGNNLIDAWLEEAKKDAGNKYLAKKYLPSILIDLFIAGSDTTTNTLSWSLLYMMKYPEIQAKVQQEIDNIIGRERTPSMSDQKLMPYTEATLMEVNRIVTIAPLALEHMANRDTTLQGYFIPENTCVIINLWAVHHDPDVFPQPEQFKPQRFLDDSGKVKKLEGYMPFSIGKRQCMGESLARMELFLYFTSMLQQFTFKPIEGREVDFDYHFALVSIPKPQPIYAVAR